MNCNTTHYRANSSSVPGDPTQSFFGDLAARLLAEAVLELLWTLPVTSSWQAAQVAQPLGERLTALTLEATEHVRRLALPEDLAPVVRDVLEQKRALGTEANFVAGVIETGGGADGAVALAWLGDLRLRLWDGAAERSAELGETFHTRERWSSRRGVVGSLHATVRPLAAQSRIAAYSDGLASLDTQPAVALDNSALDALVNAASQQLSSDDVSFLEIALTATK